MATPDPRPQQNRLLALFVGFTGLSVVYAVVQQYAFEAFRTQLDYFGLFDIAPLPISRSDDMHDLLEEAHELLAFSMIALILLHVAGALKHHVQGHRHLTARMVPWLERRRV